MTSFWTRTKRRAVAVLAASAAGAAAAYCAYTWYSTYYSDATPPEDIDQDLDQPSTSGSTSLHHHSPDEQPAPTLLSPHGNIGSSQADAEAHLQHHFDSIQDIANSTTLPSLLPALAHALSSPDSLEALLDRLRLARAGSITMSPDEKKLLWDELAIASLARAVASLWVLPLLSLHVRVQLNILGRHLYLETALSPPPVPSSSYAMESLSSSSGTWFSHASSSRSPPQSTYIHPMLSPPSQEAFLSYTEHLTRQGHVELLEYAKDAARRALDGVSLDEEFDAPALNALLSNAIEYFSASVSQSSWVRFLLPSPSALADSLRIDSPNDRAVLFGAEQQYLVDTDMVCGMMNEVASILESRQFNDVVMICVRDTSHRFAEHVHDRLKKNTQLNDNSTASVKMPLARIVPIIASESKKILMPSSEWSAAVNALPEVHAMCATVYSCGCRELPSSVSATSTK